MGALPARKNNYIAFDSDLPSVAAMAAAQVDDLLRGEGGELPYLERLAEVIGRTVENDISRSQVAFRLIDPVSIDVMSKSVADFKGAPLQSIDELAQAIYDLTNEIAKVQKRDETLLQRKSFLTQLKLFCISLSRHALASKDITGRAG